MLNNSMNKWKKLFIWTRFEVDDFSELIRFVMNGEFQKDIVIKGLNKFAMNEHGFSAFVTIFNRLQSY